MNAFMPRVSIGLPTYNRPELLALVLECFRRQTFADFELIISDNASPNLEVKQLVRTLRSTEIRGFATCDRPANQGRKGIFGLYTIRRERRCFMWASDDDLWPSTFWKKGSAALEANPHASAWFCQVVNINHSWRGRAILSKL